MSTPLSKCCGAPTFLADQEPDGREFCRCKKCGQVTTPVEPAKVACSCNLTKVSGGGGFIHDPNCPVHTKGIFEYDGSYKCLRCGNAWGAITNPKPCTCGEPAKVGGERPQYKDLAEWANYICGSSDLEIAAARLLAFEMRERAAELDAACERRRSDGPPREPTDADRELANVLAITVSTDLESFDQRARRYAQAINAHLRPERQELARLKSELNTEWDRCFKLEEQVKLLTEQRDAAAWNGKELCKQRNELRAENEALAKRVEAAERLLREAVEIHERDIQRSGLPADRWAPNVVSWHNQSRAALQSQPVQGVKS